MGKIFLPVLLSIHILILSRLTFTAWPEMLSYPYLFSHGFTFYKDFIMPYPPGLVIFLAGVFNVFGFTSEVLKAITWGSILSADLLIYAILKRTTKSGFASLFFLGAYILLQPFLEGNMLWFDFATVIPLLAAFWFSLKWVDNNQLKNLFWVGFFLTLAILIKQTAVIYLLGFLGFFCLNRGIRGIREIKGFGVGVLVAVIPLAAYLVVTGTLTHFWNWVFLYPLTEWSKFPGYVDFLIPKKYILIVALLLAPVVMSFTSLKNILKDKVFILSLFFLAAAFLSVYPRFSFFHLQPAVAFAVITFSIVFAGLSKRLKVAQAVLVSVAVLVIVKILYPVNFSEPTRFYGESEERLSKEISVLIGSNKKVFLLGLDSSLYVFSKTLPPKNWSDNFGWYLEIPGVQEWVLEGFISNRPEKILWRVPSSGPWFKPGVYQPEKVVNYINLHYDKDGELEPGVEIWTRKN